MRASPQRIALAAAFVLTLGSCGDSPPSPPAAPASSFHFEEAAARSGLDFKHRAGDVDGKFCIVDTLGSGVAVADFDGDGNLDAYFANGGPNPAQTWTREKSALFHGDGRGNFRRGTPGADAEETGYATGVAAADYDRDGDVDIYVCCPFGPNRLLRNRGDATFEDVGAIAGVAAPGASSSAAWGDLDGDGLLDLLVCDYVVVSAPATYERRDCLWAGVKTGCGPKSEKPGSVRRFRNRGDGTFVEESEKLPLDGGARPYPLALQIADLDADGDRDVYVANDSTPNFFWSNDGKGDLTEIGVMNGTALSNEGMAQAGMGVVADDLDGDGRVDLFVTNFARDHNSLYRGREDGTFDEIAQSVGLGAPSWHKLAWGCNAADFDLDGDLDLFVANGHVFPQVDLHPLETSYAQTNLLFRNLGGMRFEDASAAAGPAFRSARVSRGSVVADFDDDGRPDVLISNLDGPPELYMNRSTAVGAWLKVRVRGAPGVCDVGCVGTVVTMRCGDRVQRREIAAGGSYASTCADDVHFGVPAGAKIDEVVVRYPDGAVETVRDAAPNRRVEFRRKP